MTLAAVASVATTSLPAIIKSILTGVPSVGPLPSMPTNPSITVRAGFITLLMSTTTLLMPLRVIFELELVRQKPEHVFHAQRDFGCHVSFEFRGADDGGFRDDAGHRDAA